MSTQADPPPPATPEYPEGQHLFCPSCRAEIAITSASSAHPPEQVFVCCGQEMRPSSGLPADAIDEPE